MWNTWNVTTTEILGVAWDREDLVLGVPGRLDHPGSGGAPGPAEGDGNLFCSEVGRAARCHVVARTELQVIGVNRVLPYGCLDTYEGLMPSFSPDGVVTWSRRYPSTYDRGAAHGWAQNPD